MTTPIVLQGNLNKLRASVVFASLQALNVTAPYLGREGISMAFSNDAGAMIPTLTGGVPSPEPYQMCTVTMHLNKSQPLSSTYKAQFESNTNVGDFTVIPDSSTLNDYHLVNGILLGVEALSLNGTDAGFVVRLQGIYYVNSTLFDAA